MMGRVFNAMACMLLVFAGAAAVNAQQFTGGVRGAVSDANGVIPGVTVTLTNEATGVSSDTNTNASGDYVFPQVPVGTYRMEFDLAGFKKNLQRGVNVDVNQVVSGFGTAPLPPPAKDDMAAIGRTNDAILYGGRATVFVDADDAQLAGEQVGAPGLCGQRGRPAQPLRGVRYQPGERLGGRAHRERLQLQRGGRSAGRERPVGVPDRPVVLDQQ